ncbi:MAG TPA: biotin/lipoyl-containing protein, partial [Alphaproteobacteria bacterium]|nr:biotin/lipoyl-containing protein [Alphaproteobacteria bacterium]
MEIKVPPLGESVSEATVAKWFVAEGEAIAKDQPLVELETEKVTLEVNAPVSGVLSKIVAPAGTNVPV